MKSFNKKIKKNSDRSKSQGGQKDFAQLNELEKKNKNKPLNTGNHIEQKWFPKSK